MLPVVSMVFSRKSKINRRAGRAWPNQDPRPFTGAEKHRGVYPKGVSLVKKQKKSFRMPTAFTVLIPVSYTHLDVYKRQALRGGNDIF